MIGCLTETTTCVVAKPLVLMIAFDTVFKMRFRKSNCESFHKYKIGIYIRFHHMSGHNFLEQ